MAVKTDSTIIYQDQIDICKKHLSVEQFGRLMIALFTEDPEVDEDIALAYEFLALQKRIDSEKYAAKVERNRENGKKGGRPKTEKTERFSEKPNGFFKNPTVSVGYEEKPNGFFENPNDNDNDNDNKNDNDNESSPGSDIDSLSSSLISFLNQESGGDYKPDSYIKGRLRALMSQGYTETDFRKVIRKKSDEWRGSKMAAYLRPSTLFGDKFAEYLAAPDPTRSGKKSTEDLQKILDEKTDSLNLIHSRLTEIGGVNMKDNYDEYNDLKLKAAHLEDEIANINERMGE